MLKKLMENKLLLIIIVWTIILLIVIGVRKLPNLKSKKEVDNSMTIEVEREPTGMEELTEEEQMTYELSDVVVGLDNGKTIITGKVANNNEEAHEIIVNIKFYSEEEHIKGANSVKVALEAYETKDFEMMILDDVSQYRYDIIVEYAK